MYWFETQQSGRSKKAYLRGTHRAVSPEETLSRVQPLLPVMGISRVANITGLDCLGVPVFMACRPNSRSLAVFQGKGLDMASAKASAVMEAIETYHAETIDLPLKYGANEELRYSNHLLDVSNLPFSRAGRYHPQEPIHWIESRDLVSGASPWLPFELVHANFTLPALSGSGAFPATTNGLASGNTDAEAICHGLLEVIERDAVTLWQLRGAEAQDQTSIALDTIDDPEGQALIESFRQAGLDVVLWDVTSDIGVATILCLLVDKKGSTVAPELGAGAHTCKEVALCRALTEAAQARTTFIAGSRDDIGADCYRDAALRERFRQARETVALSEGRRRFQDVADFSGESAEDDLKTLVSALSAIGLQEVLAVDLTKQGLGIPVFRVVVPGLEAAYESEESDYLPGARALQLLDTLEGVPEI